jgi:hypothetical protein
MMTLKSGVLLLVSCLMAIAGVGSVFELTSGNPELGQMTTSLILAGSIPSTAICFWLAVADTRANYK